MFLVIISSIVLGIIIGIFTGLIPGIHINLISVLVLSYSSVLLLRFPLISVVIFIVSMAVTHTFLDSIPSIFLGAPDEAQALGVLPGHRYVLQGNGMMALKLTLIGSYGALLFSIVLFFPGILIVRHVYPLIENYIGFLLIMVVLFMLIQDRKKLWALFIFSLSGVLGIIVFNLPSLTNPLFPMLSGLFGISTLAISLNRKEKIPEQKFSDKIELDKKRTVQALSSGSFSGFLTAVFPGIGSGIAALLAMQITRNLKDHGFMVLIGSINTFNFIFSLVTFWVLDKARNGAVITVQELLPELNISFLMIMLSSVVIAGSVGVFLTLFIGKRFTSLLNKMNYQKITVFVISLIILLVIFLTGLQGLIVLTVSSFIGMLPALIKTRRIHSMGCLLLPVLFYFLL
ncbi:tripartite tricarboxylate transporter permease [Candidatus Woesearchaeota archaeon]|nr:tripartite tricarboxylate transporter permease [Candidatus Woesearchaeota archaeon]